MHFAGLRGIRYIRLGMNFRQQYTRLEGRRRRGREAVYDLNDLYWDYVTGLASISRTYLDRRMGSEDGGDFFLPAHDVILDARNEIYMALASRLPTSCDELASCVGPQPLVTVDICWGPFLFFKKKKRGLYADYLLQKIDL